MKVTKHLAAIPLAAIGLLTSCDESMFTADQTAAGTGTILPVVSCDATVISGSSTRSDEVKEVEDLTAGDVTLKLINESGTEVLTCAGNDFPTEKAFPTGKYTMTASYGDFEEEGFETPSLYGEKEFEVTDDKTTTVGLTAAFNKALVSVKFGESAVNYFTSLSASLETSLSNKIDFSNEETRRAYVSPGVVTLYVSYTKPNSTTVNKVQAAQITANAKSHYTVSINIGGEGVGDISEITLKFDDSTDDATIITVDISEEVVISSAPEITLTGAVEGQTISMIYGSTLDYDLRYDIKSQAGIKSAVLKTTGNSNGIPTGWLTEIDLVSADAAQQQVLKNLGFEDIGILGSTDATLAAFNLKGVINNLPGTAQDTDGITFSLVVTDKNDKETEGPSFNVKIDAVTLKLYTADETVYNGENSVEILAEFTGVNLSSFLSGKVYYDATNGYDKPLENFSVSQTDTNGSYVIKMTVPDDIKISDGNIIFTFQISTNDSRTLAIPIGTVPSVTINENDVFAKSAWVTINGGEGRNVTLEVSSSSNVNYSTVTTAASGTTDYQLTGLTPGTAYSVRARVGALISSAATFTTETAAQIPGSDMETWTTATISKSFVKTYTWTNYTPLTPWSTFNDMTLSTCSTNGQRTGAASTESTSDCKSGSAAALILNVGWGSVTTISGEDAGNRTPGELFLGTFAYSGSTANPSYGTEFTSRPSALKFWYKYDAYATGEKGIVEIKVIDNSGNVIATGYQELDAIDSYTEYTVNLSYPRNSSKASKISVRFVACNQTGSFSVCDVSLNAQWIGSKLYVDDIELVY